MAFDCASIVAIWSNLPLYGSRTTVGVFDTAAWFAATVVVR